MANHRPRCYSCHQFDGLGVDLGPNLKGWGGNRSVEEIATALIHPSAGIAHGFDSHEVTLEPNWKDRKSFWRINGIILSESDPLTIKSAGGLVQKVPSHEIHFIQPSRHSLMLSASIGNVGAGCSRCGGIPENLLNK